MSRYCIFCGVIADDFTYIGNSRVPHCNSNDCLRDLEEEQRNEVLYEEEDKMRELWEEEPWR